MTAVSELELSMINTTTTNRKTKKAKQSGKIKQAKAKKPTSPLTKEQQEKVRRANGHYKTAVRNYLSGNNKAAETAVRTAIKLNPLFVDAIMLKERICQAMHPTSALELDGTISSITKAGVTIHKDAHGRYLPGQVTNPNGRGSGNNIGINDLFDAIRNVEASKKDTLMVHLIKRGFKSDTVLLGIIKKLVPDLKSFEGLLGLIGLQTTPEEAAVIQKEIAQRYER